MKKKARFTDLGSLIESLETGLLQGEMELRTNCGLKLYHMMPLPISMNNQKLNDLDRTVASNCPDRRLKTLSLPQPLEVCSALPLPALHPLKYWWRALGLLPSQQSSASKVNLIRGQ